MTVNKCPWCKCLIQDAEMEVTVICDICGAVIDDMALWDTSDPRVKVEQGDQSKQSDMCTKCRERYADKDIEQIEVELD